MAFSVVAASVHTVYIWSFRMCIENNKEPHKRTDVRGFGSMSDLAIPRGVQLLSLASFSGLGMFYNASHGPPMLHRF